MMIGFTAKAVIVLLRGFVWRCSWIALDRNPSALATGQNVRLCLLISLWNLMAVAACPTESAMQFFCALAFFVDAPGVIG